MAKTKLKNKFTVEELREYEKCTFFSRAEIKKLLKIYLKLGSDGLEVDEVFTKDDILSHEKLTRLKMLKSNPFRNEIIQIFSSDERGLTFDDFVDLCSAFSPRATSKIKEVLAFYIFDFTTGDGEITKEDLEVVVSKMVDKSNVKKAILSDDDVSLIATKVLNELDVDQDGSITQNEFSRICSRIPDFSSKFSFRIS